VTPPLVQLRRAPRGSEPPALRPERGDARRDDTPRALPTLNADGTRHVLAPRLSPGRFLRRRRWAGYSLIAMFVLLPHLRIGGRPPLLIDLVHREISLAGAVFRPSEGMLLMLLGLAVVLTVFTVTALWGRVWCGYGCPQTVYLELVFRPIERWIWGSAAERRRRSERENGWRRRAMWALFAVLAFALANVFLSYFVPTELLARWITSSPAQHPGGFAVVAAVTALMFFDFAYFREQTCTVACPYGRLQSVLLDRKTLVVGYDARRGEPRGKAKDASAGDCVDCGACVATCPTGIDIRDGLQMECVGCAQCIDACDPIMEKLGRPQGLIRYASQDELAGEGKRGIRARIWIYPALLAVIVGALVVQLARRGDSELWLLRGEGEAFALLDGGHVSTPVRLKIENRSAESRRYAVSLDGDATAQLISPRPELVLEGGHAEVLTLFVLSSITEFHGGTRASALVVREGGRVLGRLPLTLLGPEQPVRSSKETP
jgi:cytochrome c oxidase accessory protein FixG